MGLGLRGMMMTLLYNHDQVDNGDGRYATLFLYLIS